MSFFEQIYGLAQAYEEKSSQSPPQDTVQEEQTLSLLMIYDNAQIDCTIDFALTPAGQLAMRGNMNAALWLWKNFRANLGLIYYGAILGGHFQNIEAAWESLCQNESNNDHRPWIILAFAQKGWEEELIAYFPRRNSTHPLNELKAAIEGAAYGNHPQLLTYLLELPHNPLLTLPSALQAAACGGHWQLVQQLLDRVKPGVQEDFLLSLREQAIQGFIRGNQTHLLDQAFNSWGKIRLLKSAIHSAINYHQYRLAQNLASQEKDTPEFYKALGASSTQQLNETFLNTQTTDAYLWLAIPSKKDSPDQLIHWLSFANDAATVTKICECIKTTDKAKVVMPNTVAEIARIETEAQAILKLKSSFLLETKQAIFVHQYQHPLLALLQCEYSGKEGFIHFIQGSPKITNPFNTWQLADIFEKVQGNKVRNILIEELKTYIKKHQGLRFNYLSSSHYERCQSFLKEVLKKRSREDLNVLVLQQYQLFQLEDAGDKLSTITHEKPLKNKNVRDDYYLALEKFINQLTKIEKELASEKIAEYSQSIQHLK